MKTALIVEDDVGVRQFLKVFLESVDLNVIISDSIVEALQQCSEQPVDLVILDYNLPHGEVGWSIAKEVRSQPSLYGTPKIIGTSGTIDPRTVEKLGFERGNFDIFLPKPFDIEVLRGHVKTLLDV